MLKRILLSVFILLNPVFLFAQVGDYSFSTSTTTYTEVTSPTILHSTGQDDEMSALTNIGFTFTYNGINYTNYKVSTNGFVNLGGSLTDSYYSNELSSNVKKIIITPLWDDYNTANGNISYKLTGTSPSRVLTIQFKNIEFYNVSAAVNFQVKLYEGSNNIEFIYGTMDAFNSASASVGLNDEVDNSFLSVTPGSGASNSTANDNITSNTNLSSGTLYLFEPPSGGSGSAPNGDGSEGNPFQIATLDDLQWIVDNSGHWNKHFIQTADIDASATSGWDGGAGFTPIGNGTTDFDGTYDGNGHIISNLYINRPSTSQVGFAGYSYYGEVKNLGLVNANITGANTVGTIMGTNLYGDINNCYATGTVSGANSTGGIAGSSTGNINNSYSHVNVTGTYNVGGFVGHNDQTYGKINDCYSTGTVSATSNPAGFTNNGTTTNCFWDTQTSGESSSGRGTGKTTAEMKTLATFTDVLTAGLTSAWDFETNPNDDSANNNHWDIDIGGSLNNGYPYLAWQDGVDTSLPVELTFFTAHAEAGVVTLKWCTASEILNDAFLVERSTDAKTFELLAQIKGAGTTSVESTYLFVDKNVENGITYYYRLSDRDYAGKLTIHSVIQATPVVTEFKLHTNYPNPFNPRTTIRFDIPATAKPVKVHLSIFNTLGKQVDVLQNSFLSGGQHKMIWDASGLPSGIYFLHLKAGQFERSQKLHLLK